MDDSKCVTLGEFFREYDLPCALGTFRKLVTDRGVPHVPGSRPYLYPLEDLLRAREDLVRAAERRRRTL